MKIIGNLGFLALSTLLFLACSTDSEDLNDEVTNGTSHSLDDLESTTKANGLADTANYGTEHEGIDKKDLEKKSADYEPDEVKFKKSKN